MNEPKIIPGPPLKPRKYLVQFLDTFPHGYGLHLHEARLKEGDRLIVLKMTGKREGVLMVDE